MQGSADFKLVRLANGIRSVHSVEYGETFHPVIGPVAEAQALYVRQLKLLERLRGHRGEFVVWDVGLGAAANPLTVLQATREIPCHLRLVSFDQTTAPLEFALEHAAQLEYLAGYETFLSRLIANARLKTPRESLDFTHGRQRVTWELHLCDFPRLLDLPAAQLLPKPHAILFDAYSPAANAAMWTLPLFTRLYRLLDPQRPCALPTYSRSTLLRVTLLLAGFFVGKGHATGEKEETTLAANTRSLIDDPLDLRWLRRARNSTSAEPLREPFYRQAPLSDLAWKLLSEHPQFREQLNSAYG
jgi:tRNA U34 5-methylaminomethyl-2-thiouridine-forming methyltransferase MnmC